MYTLPKLAMMLEKTSNNDNKLCIIARMILWLKNNPNKGVLNCDYTIPIVYELNKQQIRLNIFREYIENQHGPFENPPSDREKLIVLYMEFWHESANRFPDKLIKISELEIV